MKVHAYAADAGGCGYYRIIHPVRALQASGEVDVRLFGEGDPESNLPLVCEDRLTTVDYLSGRKPERSVHVVDVNPPDCDVVVLQRPLLRLIADAIPHLQAHGIAVVVEVDDDFHAIHPKNIAYTTADPKLNAEHNRDHLLRACQQADLVTVSTPALAARYGKHGRVQVLPNLLPDTSFDVAPLASAWRTSRPWVGWSGSLATHPTDLQATGGAVGRAMRDTPWGMYVVGTGVGVREALALPDELPFCPVGWVPIEDYPQAMAAMQVGIVPLETNAFNVAKSWLKGLEMAALGIPFIASATDEYIALAAKGAGIVASKPKHWQTALTRLLTDDAYRMDAGLAARAAVEDMRYSRQSSRWAEAWEQARVNHALRRVDHVRSAR